jgi:hypothetical protein
VNDKAQDGNTAFPDDDPFNNAPWNNQDGDAGRNGNGAVVFTVSENIRHIDLTALVPAPVAGAVPETAPREGYGGSVDWTLTEGKSTARFEGEAVYQAAVTLTPPEGFQFSGSGVMVSHSGTSNILLEKETATEVKMVVRFKATGAWEYNGRLFSGSSSGTEIDSVIDIIRQAKEEGFSALSLKLATWPETVNLDASAETDIGAGLVLTADDSPVKVTIDGGGKEIALGSGKGSVITVGAGVTLTLRNITFKGSSDNSTSLIKVETGGKLILREGAVIKDNKGAGVSISGSNSVVEMYAGAEIKDNGSSGVNVDKQGSFTMSGGTISGNTALLYSGGGVFVYDSTFSKTGGTIYGNDVAAPLANTAGDNNKRHAVYFESGMTAKRCAGTVGENDKLWGDSNSTSGAWD